jgi:serine/threonine protein kinase
MSLVRGTRLGPYEVVSKLGDGGMGEVYRAYDPRLKRQVALKLLTTATESGDRLLREARAIAALNHPHICTVFEVGAADGRAFIAMELIEGRSLRSIIPASGLPASACTGSAGKWPKRWNTRTSTV